MPTQEIWDFRHSLIFSDVASLGQSTIQVVALASLAQLLVLVELARSIQTERLWILPVVVVLLTNPGLSHVEAATQRLQTTAKQCRSHLSQLRGEYKQQQTL